MSTLYTVTLMERMIACLVDCALGYDGPDSQRTDGRVVRGLARRKLVTVDLPNGVSAFRLLSPDQVNLTRHGRLLVDYLASISATEREDASAEPARV